MARLVFQSGIYHWLQLAQNMNETFVADPTAAGLAAFFSQNNIVPADDLAALQQAYAQELLRNKLMRDAEEQLRWRNTIFDPIFKTLKAAAQYLKRRWPGQQRQLGGWGIDVNGKNRLVYARRFQDMAAQALQFFEKHLSYPAGTSPLQSFFDDNAIDATLLPAAIGDALAKNSDAASLRRQAEEATKNRNILAQKPKENLRHTGSYLCTLYVQNPKQAGLWGYTVDDSKRAVHLRTVRLKPATEKYVRGVVIGSFLKNLGQCEVLVYRGLKKKHAPATVLPGQQLEIEKGMGVLVFQNKNLLISAIFYIEQFK